MFGKWHHLSTRIFFSAFILVANWSDGQFDNNSSDVASIRVGRNIHTAFGRPRFRARSAIDPTTINFCQIPPYTVRPSPGKRSIRIQLSSLFLPRYFVWLARLGLTLPPPKKTRKGSFHRSAAFVCHKSHRLSYCWKKFPYTPFWTSFYFSHLFLRKSFSFPHPFWVRIWKAEWKRSPQQQQEEEQQHSPCLDPSASPQGNTPTRAPPASSSSV